MNEHAYGYVNHRDLRALSDFQSSSCLTPERISFNDLYTHKLHSVLVPCGHCYQCLNSKGNDLYTRIFLDGSILGHAYFITLNFRSYDYKKNIPSELHGMYWHKDSNNYYQRLTYSPQLIDKTVFRSFIKRLKYRFKNETLEYILCTELGSKFHRPHAHMILLSSCSISLEDIRSLWPYGKIEPSYVDSSGKYLVREFDDLFASGAFDFIGNNSAKHSIKYVTKYASKGGILLSDPKYDKLQYLDYISSHLLGYSDIPYGDVFKLSNYQTELIKTYERTHKLQTLYKYGRYIEPLRLVLYSLFQPSVFMSRCPSLGSLFAQANIQTILSKSKKLPTPHSAAPQSVLQSKNGITHTDKGLTLLFPRSYNRIAKKYSNPLCLYLKSFSNSTSKSLASYHDFLSLCFAISTMHESFSFSVPYRHFTPVRLPNGEIISLFRDNCGIPNLTRNIRILFGGSAYNPNGILITAASLYDQHSKLHYVPALSTSGLCFAVLPKLSSLEPSATVSVEFILQTLEEQLNNYRDEYNDTILNLELTTDCYCKAKSDDSSIYNKNINSIFSAWEDLKNQKQNEQIQKNRTSNL